MDSNDEELLVFDEELSVFKEVTREEEESNHEDEGPCQPIQTTVIPKTRKRPN